MQDDVNSVIRSTLSIELSKGSKYRKVRRTERCVPKVNNKPQEFDDKGLIAVTQFFNRKLLAGFRFNLTFGHTERQF